MNALNPSSGAASKSERTVHRLPGKFDGKVVLVTGASRGIGAAIAKAFAAEGAMVLVNYLRNSVAANEVVAHCQALGGEAWALQADVRSREAVEAMVAEALSEVGQIDVLVNNALSPYAFDPEQRPRFGDIPWAAYQEQFEASVQAAYHTCQALLEHFKRRGQGSIVNLVSDLVEHPVIAYHDYSTAKSALVGFSRNLAADLGPLGIRVNCVAPGLVFPTESSRHTQEAVKDAIISQTPLGRIANPDDIAGPVLFLASSWSRFMTGQVLVVDGGLVMK